MFTGLVEELGEIENIEQHGDYVRLSIKSSLQRIEIGESISINGACQTVEKFEGGQFWVAAFAQTLQKTNLGLLKRAEKVHLERALQADARLGGHIVQGHVDGLGTLRELRKERNNYYLRVQLPTQLHDLCIEHGSICLDGVSLTIAKLLENSIEVNIIEHTWQHCNFSLRSVGASINVECDVLGKYILRFAQRGLLANQMANQVANQTADQNSSSLLDLLKDW